MLQNILLIYALVISVAAFCAMGIDKSRAKRHLWRIPEKMLFLFVLLGGGVGGTLGMFAFHHKTKHWYFRYGFPVITVIELLVGVYLTHIL